MNLLKRISISPNHRGLIESFLSLSAVNGANIILPLITLPYLVRTVGLSNYGAYSIVYTIIQYVLLISTYGFNYTTTKQIAQNRDNIQVVQTIFYSTIYARFIITILAIIIGLIAILVIYPPVYLLMYIGGLGIVVGDVLNPVWLFQGFEKMRYMTYANLVCKTLFTVLIFLFVREKDDYIYITLWNSAGFIASGLITLVISFRIFRLRLTKVSCYDIWHSLKEGWTIFLSTIFMNIYRNSNIFLLGLFVSDYGVGVYSTAEKVVKAIQLVTAPVSNALFPYLSSSFSRKSIKDCSLQILSINRKICILFAVVSLALLVFSGFINEVFFGDSDQRIADLIRYMSLVILIGGMNYILGIAGLVNLNQNKYFFLSVTVSGIFSLILLVVSVNYIDLYSGALAMISAELILFIMCYCKIRRLSK